MILSELVQGALERYGQSVPLSRDPAAHIYHFALCLKDQLRDDEEAERERLGTFG